MTIHIAAEPHSVRRTGSQCNICSDFGQVGYLLCRGGAVDVATKEDAVS
jgi:hypothetical protein